MGGVALVIDVDKIDSPVADVMGDNQRQSKQISQSEDEEERKRQEKVKTILILPLSLRATVSAAEQAVAIC